MTCLKQLVYLPEGNYRDLNNYSGTPYYLGNALNEVCYEHGIKFTVVEVPEMINTEPIYELAISANQSKSCLESKWNKLPIEQRKTPSAQKLYKALKKKQQS